MAADTYLADTNILLRLTRRDDPEYLEVRTAVQTLWEYGARLCYTSQNLIEFWNVATRAKNHNGFGLSTDEANREAVLIEKALALLPDNEQIHHRWRELVVRYSVSGVQVHDARLVAAMNTHGIVHLLTLNGRDFVRYPGIEVIHPRQIAGK